MVSQALLSRALVGLVRRLCHQCVAKCKPKGADWRGIAKACACRQCAIWHTRPGNAPTITREPRPC
jgi:hypothetical protein